MANIKTFEQRLQDAQSRYSTRSLMISIKEDLKKQYQKELSLLKKYQRRDKALIKRLLRALKD